MVKSLLASDFTKHMWINTVNKVNRTEGSGYVNIMTLGNNQNIVTCMRLHNLVFTPRGVKVLVYKNSTYDYFITLNERQKQEEGFSGMAIPKEQQEQQITLS